MFRISKYIILPVFLLLLLPASLVAQTQEPEERLLQSDPQELLQLAGTMRGGTITTTIADMENRDVREAPANVQIITAKQIEASGARDLFEALQLVPGLSFGRDVDDVVGIGIHGNWAGEGKCLFLLNGSQLNENDFGTYAIGQRIPLDNIERIEVVMGPGSVIHGGYAALGVINIVTRTADSGPGSRAVIRNGFAHDGTTRSSVSISGAHRLSRNQEISYLTAHVRGRRSNAFSLLPDSTPLSFADSTAMQSSTFQFNYRWKDLKATVLFMEESFEVSDASYSVNLRDIIFGLEQRTALNKRTDLFWKVAHTDQLPWYYLNTSDPGMLASNTSNQRSSGMVMLSHRLSGWMNTRLGVQGYRQRSTFQQRTSEALFAMNERRSILMNDLAAFAEANAHGRAGSLTAGYRYEYNDLSGHFVAPRIAYTRAIGRFHGKLLYSKAFKTPTVMNLNYGPEDGQVVAEYVTAQEVELGLLVGTSLRIRGNAYRTQLDDPIVYVYDEQTLDNYVNRPRSGTEGMDVRAVWESKRTLVMIAYGMHRSITLSDLPESELPEGTGRGYQGLPTQRAMVTMAWDASNSITLRLRGHWHNEVWSYQYASVDAEGTTLHSWAPETVLNTGLTWRTGATDRFVVEAGCNNLLDTERRILGPYNSGTTPLTLNGREWTLALTFKFVQ